MLASMKPEVGSNATILLQNKAEEDGSTSFVAPDLIPIEQLFSNSRQN